MSYIILCSTGSDMLSRIDTESLELRNYILSGSEKSFGPHEITLYKDKIVTANNYNGTISIIDRSVFESNTDEEYFRDRYSNIYVGAYPNDVVQYENNFFVTCGESNSVIVYDLENEKISFNIPVGIFPHNITIYEKKKLAFVSNMGDDSISVIDLRNKKEIKRITVENTPIKISLSNNNDYLYVCMSYLGYDKEGYVGIISLDSLELVYKIKAGFSPVDLFEDNEYLYVSNFCGNSISILNIHELKEERKIHMSGMPRGIVKYHEKIFTSDYLNGVVRIIDLEEKEIKVIAAGKEPNAMTLIK
ncbi:MAG: YncE family protein [Clostridium sp.]